MAKSVWNYNAGLYLLITLSNLSISLSLSAFLAFTHLSVTNLVFVSLLSPSASFSRQGWAAGKGTSTGTYKGHQLFTCPEACALFVPASQLTLRRFSRETDAAERQPSNTSAPHNPPSAQPPTSHQTVSILSRTAESIPGPASPTAPALQQGQRVIFTQDEAIQTGRVVFCGALPGRSSGGVFVGLLLVSV